MPKRPPVVERPALLALSLILFFMGPRANRAGEGPVKLVRTSDRGLVFHLDLSGYQRVRSTFLVGCEKIFLEGFGCDAKPGEPALPSRRFLIALPPGATYSLRFEASRVEDIGVLRFEPVPLPRLGRDESGGWLLSQEYAIREPAYSDYVRREVVETEDVVSIRYQRVLPVSVHPVLYNPRTGETKIATLIRIEVVFSYRRAPDEGGGELWNEVRESKVWEDILSRVLVNPEEASRWRVRKRRPERVWDVRSESLERALSGPLFKLKVRETGLYKLEASSLAAEGFPQGEPLSQIKLFKRGYDKVGMSPFVIDIPFLIREDTSGTEGVFDGSDELIFYGLRLREDTLQSDPFEKFSDHNVYWLGTTGGLTMPEVTLKDGLVGGDTSAASFSLTERYEEDRVFLEATPPLSTGSFFSRQDFYYFNLPDEASLSVPFTVWALKPGTFLELRAELLGGDDKREFREVKMSLVNEKGTFQLMSAFVSKKNRILYTSGPISGSFVAEGENTLLLEPSDNRSLLEVSLNWFSASYSSLYRAQGDFLHFHSADLTGDTTITVTGLSRKDLLLFDVSDPYQPRACLPGDSLFTPVGAGFALSFRDSFASRKEYILTAAENIPAITPADIELDSPSSLIGGPLESGVDVLVISHRNFLGEMQRWVDYRKAQGYRVLVADVTDVYDEFGGGVPGAEAVKNFISYYFDKAGASFVLLVGDASEDNKRVHSDSGINFVPTQSYAEHVTGGPFNLDEVVTSDKWYAMMESNPGSGEFDFYPDLIVGRLPAGSTLELRIMLDKIFGFEDAKASEFWRKRMVMVADDAWSSPAILNSCYQSSEQGFEMGEEQAASIIDSSLAGGYKVVRFYLSEYTDAVHPPQTECMDFWELVNFTRANVLPVFLEELGSGATLVSIQAHMNRYLICHEALFTSSRAYGVRDHAKLANASRPFIVFGMGCHMSDYAIYLELARVLNNDANGDCLNEIFLFLNNRGAVATYGSSGFEYLDQNAQYTGIIYQTFFNSPPRDTVVAGDGAQARWIFGELMTLSEIRDLAGNNGLAKGHVVRYHILGDPLLRVDAGPPRFEVRLNGVPFESGDLIRIEGDTISVEAVVADETAIEKFKLEIDGNDASEALTITPLVDQALSAARKYRVVFNHRLLPKTYDIVLSAHQLPDTSAGEYDIIGEFVFRVRQEIDLAVNGRRLLSGDAVPQNGDYLIELDLPVHIDPSLISVEVDGEPVTQLDFSHPGPEDTKTWLVRFSRNLAKGAHTISVFVDSNESKFFVYVGSRLGISDLITYPNPFTTDTYFVYYNEVEITKGSIDIFTTSGKKIAHLDIPLHSGMPGQNAVYWDGRDFAGDPVANGVYLYVFSAEQRGKKSLLRGKLVKAE